MSINTVVLAGRLTKDPELKYSGNGVPMCRFTLAVNRQFKKEGSEEADFINCISFNKTAENLANFQKKGSLIGIEGRIQTGKFEKDGAFVYTTDVLANSIQFLESKKEQPQTQHQIQQPVSNQFVQQQQGLPQQQQGFTQQMNTGQLAPQFVQTQQFAKSDGPLNISEDDLPF